MPQKGKIPAKEKVRIIEEYLTGRIGNSEAREIGGVAGTTLRRWINLYQTEGPKGFQPSARNRVYPAVVKERAVKDYLGGKGSLAEICRKYGIKEDTQLRRWIKVYNRHEEFKTFTGGSRMTTARKTMKEERLAIADECIARGCNYGETEVKYNVSYQQVYIWVKKMQEQGETGLDDRRGQRPLPHEPQTAEEKLKAEVEQLKKANYRLKMENDFLKKLKEVEGRNR